MTALADARLTTASAVLPEKGSFPIEANTRTWKGGMVALNAAGNLVPAGTVGAVLIVGKASNTYNNLTGSSDFSGFANAATVEVEFGKHGWNNSAPGIDLIAAANVGQVCYAADDNVLALTAGGVGRLVAGIIDEIGVDGQIYVWQNPAVCAFAASVAGVTSGTGAADIGHLARGVVTSNVASLAAFTSVTGGTLVDGVTYAKNDRVLLVGQTTASQNGIYIVGAVAAGSAPLTRPVDWQPGAALIPGTLVQVSEGISGANTQWTVTTVAPITIDTTSVAFGFLDALGLIETSSFKARSVVTANFASLAAFVGVTGGSSTNSDGVLAVQGDIVLLTAQTTPSQNGPYVVGPVAAGSAPLVRPVWWLTTSVQQTGMLITVGGEGTLYKNTIWKSMSANKTIVVDTTDPAFFPTKVSFTAPLVAGTLTAGVGATAGAPANIPIFSANTKAYAFRRTANTCLATANGYALNGLPTPGPAGTGAISVMACVAAGTINNADISTLDVVIDNQL